LQELTGQASDFDLVVIEQVDEHRHCLRATPHQAHRNGLAFLAAGRQFSPEIGTPATAGFALEGGFASGIREASARPDQGHTKNQ
jgi:hypothetical protein